MQQFFILLSLRLFTAQHVSGVLPPIIRSSTTAVADLNCAKPVFKVRLFKLDSVTLKFSYFNWIQLDFNRYI